MALSGCPTRPTLQLGRNSDEVLFGIRQHQRFMPEILSPYHIVIADGCEQFFTKSPHMAARHAGCSCFRLLRLPSGNRRLTSGFGVSLVTQTDWLALAIEHAPVETAVGVLLALFGLGLIVDAAVDAWRERRTHGTEDATRDSRAFR